MKKGHEKSDFGIVAVKPMNKAGRPVAESVEPRPGTKGNAEQRNMHRTQGRQRMSQSLDRVRTSVATCIGIPLKHAGITLVTVRNLRWMARPSTRRRYAPWTRLKRKNNSYHPA